MNKELYDLSFEMKRAFRRKVFGTAAFVVFTCLAINVMLQFIVFPVRQKSVSMEPNVPEGACVFFTPLSKNYSRGDVVLVRPANDEKPSFFRSFADSALNFFTARQVRLSNLSHSMGNEFQVRRVLALPGDTVYMRDHVLYIRPSGEDYFLTEFELVKNPYAVNITASPAFWDSSVGVKGSFDQVELGEGEYFVFGDSRNSSVDSRLWGPVKRERIRAVALMQYFPLNRFKIFP